MSTSRRFCCIKFSTTEQHVDARDPRINRDSVDIKRFMQWLNSHEPFPFQIAVMSIAIGVISREMINCYDAFELGKASLDKIIGQNITNISFKRKDNVMPLITVSSCIRIQDEVVPIDSLLLFQRICMTKQSEEDLQKYLQYELMLILMMMMRIKMKI